MRVRIEMEVPDSTDPSDVLERAQELAVTLAENEVDEVSAREQERIEGEVSVEVLHEDNLAERVSAHRRRRMRDERS